MRDFQRPMPASRRDATADSGAMLRTLGHLWPYIWPADRRDLKDRVIFATVLGLNRQVHELMVFAQTFPIIIRCLQFVRDDGNHCRKFSSAHLPDMKVGHD